MELYDSLTSPTLRCADLVATTCEDPCDWQAAFEVPHDLRDCTHLSYDDLLILRTGDGAPDLCQFLSHKPDSEHVKEEPEEASRTCCVVGCEEAFPDAQPNGWHFAQLESPGLCQKHNKRLHRKANKGKRKVATDALMIELWKETELSADASKERAFKPCPDYTLTRKMEN